MVYSFLCKDEKTRRNIYLLLLKTSVWKEVRHFSVQCILTETTWLPTLKHVSALYPACGHCSSPRHQYVIQIAIWQPYPTKSKSVTCPCPMGHNYPLLLISYYQWGLSEISDRVLCAEINLYSYTYVTYFWLNHMPLSLTLDRGL